MKKFVLIFGPHAVGKMTVGQELAKKTGMQLFHNHMSIEPYLKQFKDDLEGRARMTDIHRKKVFDEFMENDEKGLMFTFIWHFDDESHKKEVNTLEQMFADRGIEVYFVELEADKDVRLQRNTTPNRLEHKPSKRDIELSERILEEKEVAHRLNSDPSEVQKKNYLKINNTNIDPSVVAEMIIDRFKFA